MKIWTCPGSEAIIKRNLLKIGGFTNEIRYFRKFFAMQSILNNPDQAIRIASNSYQTGIKNFNYMSYSKPLIKLFNNI